LSYSRFEYVKLDAPKTVKAGENISLRVGVTNKAKVAGDEVVQIYIKHVNASVPVPIRSLQGFKRVHLTPGKTATVSFSLTPRQLSVIDNQSRLVVEPGEIELQVGGGQLGTRGTSAGVSARVKVSGDVFLVK
jgi:beta-glucosidase